MAILSTVTASMEDFSLLDPLIDDPGVQVELETVVPTREMIIPYIRVHNSDPQTVADSIQQETSVEKYEIVERHGQDLLVRLEWIRETDGFISAIDESNGVLIRGTGTEGRWRFEIRFDSHEDLSAFFEYCRSNGLSVTIERVQNPAMEAEANEMVTTTQRETLQVAFDQGYFDIPRRADLTELATALGVSDSAVSQRLRRGLNSLVGAFLTSTAPHSEF